MRRVRYHRYGGPEVLEVEEADVPVPAAGQVVIRVEAIAANFVDTRLRAGVDDVFRRPLPGALTGSVVGTVEALGPGVDTVTAGDRVAAFAEDAFAELVTAEARWLVPVPEGMDADPATALPLMGPMALGVLRTGAAAKGDTVLVHSAAGGVGHLAVQLARLLGAGKIIATAGSEAKLDFVRELGADVAIDYTDAGWPDQVRAAAPDGVDLIADAVGGETLLRGLELLAPLGRAVVYGLISGELALIPARTLFTMRTVAGFSLMAWRTARPDEAGAAVGEVTDHILTGRLRPVTHATFPLAQVAEAHRLLDTRSYRGRVLLTP